MKALFAKLFILCFFYSLVCHSFYLKQYLIMKRIFVLIIYVFIVILVHSQQTIRQLNIKSPEVVAFEKVGDIPVSNYTGVPTISIPICELKSGDLVLPVNLDYHATAIKVDQESTWVGLNWLLNAGGVVSTQVTKSVGGGTVANWKKLYEQLKFDNFKVGDSDLFNYYKFSGSHDSDITSHYGWNIFPYTNLDSDIPTNLYQEIIQFNAGEAQLHYANFMGYSFKFIYHPILRKFIIIGKDQKFVIQGNPSGIAKITDANGINYYFDEIETNTPTGWGNQTAATYQPRSVSFYLTKIKSPSGRCIKLRYKKYGSIIPIISVNESAYSGNLSFPDGVVIRKLSPEYEINNSYLYEIESDDALVRFNVGDRIDIRGNGKKLDNIELYDLLSNKLVKRYVFSYDYYTGNKVGGDYIADDQKYWSDTSSPRYTDDQIYKRLRLTSLKEETIDDNGQISSLPPYQFLYNSGDLPGKTSAARDYWGNYNGKENNGGDYYHSFLTNLLYLGEDKARDFPTSDFNKYIKSDNRFNETTVSNGLIYSIQYPTGGKNIFIFEPHEFSNYQYKYIGDINEAFASIFTKDSEINSVYPTEITSPKAFVINNQAIVKFTIDVFNCPKCNNWSFMQGSHVYLMKKQTIQTPNGTVTYEAPIKTWALSDTTGLSGTTDKIWTETLTLGGGQYRLEAHLASGITKTAPSANYPGERFISVSAEQVIFDPITKGLGIRISKIITGEGENSIIKYYKYKQDDGSTSGILMNPVKFSRRKMLIHQPNMAGNNTMIAPILKHYWIHSSTNLIPGSENKIGYGWVEVVQQCSGDTNGREINNYWNKQNFIYECFKPLEDPRNGNLMKQLVYNRSGNLLKRTQYIYTILNKESYFINASIEDIYKGNEDAISLGVNPYAVVCPWGRAMICIYPSIKYWIDLTEKNEEDYLNGKTIKKQTLYTYNPANYSYSSIKQIIDDKYNRTQYFIYPQDYKCNNNDYPTNLVNKNIIKLPIETVFCASSPAGTLVTSSILNRYNDYGKLETCYNFETSEKTSIGNFKFSNKNTTGKIGIESGDTSYYSFSTKYIEKIRCNYSSDGNPMLLTKSTSLKIFYLWSYNHQYPIAEIQNASMEEVLIALKYNNSDLEQLNSSSTPDVDLIDKNLREYFKNKFVLIKTYKYKPLVGIISEKNNAGAITYYDYDSFGRLKETYILENGIKKVLDRYNYHYKN